MNCQLFIFVLSLNWMWKCSTVVMSHTLSHEIVLISPTPMQRFVSGSVVPIEAILYSEDNDPTNPGSLLPENWAFALTLDDGETTIVHGASVQGEIPGLADGSHSVAIALVDADGEFLGPRTRANFVVGDDTPPLFAISRPAAGILWRDAPDAPVAVAMQLARLTLPAGCELDVHLDGVRIGATPGWQRAGGGDVEPAKAGGGEGGEAWAAEVANVADGLHSVEAALRVATGASPLPPPPPTRHHHRHRHRHSSRSRRSRHRCRRNL